MKNCDFCGREKEEKDLITVNRCRICWICKENNKSKPRGRVIKTKYGVNDNSQLS